MAHHDSDHYKVKYYHQHVNDYGQVIRLEILQYVSVPSPLPLPQKKMMGLQSLRLDVQGGNEPIDTAIVKTTLAFSLVDAWDIPDTTTDKWGNWQEFYTPNATEYLVRVKVDGVILWSGYITPDAWEESLDYHGTISVTARDNIGHLQDFVFDYAGNADGLASVYDIIEAAFDKIALPMDTIWSNLGDHHTLQQGTLELTDSLVNVEAFQDKTWYDVLESLLGDLGLCARFVGGNAVVIDYLRNLPLLGHPEFGRVPQHGLKFLGGTLMLSPAYKSITDTIRYDIRDGVEFAENNLDFAGLPTTPAYSMVCGGVTKNWYAYIYPTRQESNPKHWRAEDSVSKWIDPPADAMVNINDEEIPLSQYYDSIGFDANCVLLACNLTSPSGRYLTHFFGQIYDGSTLSVTISCLPNLLGYNSQGGVGDPAGYYQTKATLKSIPYRLIYRKGDDVYYYDASMQDWYASVRDNVLEFDGGAEATIETALGSLPVGGTLAIEMRIPTGESPTDAFPWDGYYAAIKSITLGLGADTPKLESNVVRTINNETYNIENTKNVSIGVIAKSVIWASPKQYLNVLYKTNGTHYSMCGYDWQWDDAEEAFPLPALIHLQRLAYHSQTTKILNGDCVLTSAEQPIFNAHYLYKGGIYMLTGGTLDLIRGRLSDAVFVDLTNYFG